ncbi:ETC complex I subunit conserved region-domain-containing protein [Myxozyma melibiosi]|uniref:ETC complex I subunit conserved region-domain-containing protein n=1 Tax=Myxozyma melibiosi TaxID=54550 RepID=A0ABR1FE51_9ASCO
MRPSNILAMRRTLARCADLPPLKYMTEEFYRSTYLNKQTGLTGIFEFPEPRPRLLRLYAETNELLQHFPETSVYRQSVEGINKHRYEIVKTTDSIVEIEQKLGGGLIEEILIQAGEEFQLAQKMLEWKVWEPLEEEAPEGTWDK